MIPQDGYAYLIQDLLHDELSSGRVGLMTYACSLEVSQFKLVELP